MRHLSTFLSLVLTPLVAVMPLSAEPASSTESSSTSASSTSASSTSTTPGQSNILKIRLADDSKATVEANAIVKGYAILVTDSAGLPVPDAVVAVRLPDDGPSGYFLNGERSAVAYTNASGIAKFPQVNWGSTAGPLSVRVTVVKGEFHAGVLIEQTVVPQALAKAHPAPASAPGFLPDITTPAPAANTAAMASAGTPSPATPGSSVPSGASPVGVSSNAPLNTPSLAQTKPAIKTPGVPTSVAAVHSGGSPEAAAGTDTAQATDPNVSVVNTAGSKASNGNAKKWVIVAALVAGASLGAALALAGHGGAAGASGTASTGRTIGTPIISVGH